MHDRGSQHSRGLTRGRTKAKGAEAGRDDRCRPSGRAASELLSIMRVPGEACKRAARRAPCKQR